MTSLRALGVGLAVALLGVPGLVGEPAALVALAAVTVAVAALVAWTPLAAAYAGPGPACGLPARGAVPRPTSRVGDPVHHPLRPRAPGRV